MYRTDDPVADFHHWDRECERALARLPECDCCGHHVQDEYYYEINGDVVCPKCLDSHYRKWVNDYIE